MSFWIGVAVAYVVWLVIFAAVSFWPDNNLPRYKIPRVFPKAAVDTNGEDSQANKERDGR